MPSPLFCTDIWKNFRVLLFLLLSFANVRIKFALNSRVFFLRGISHARYVSSRRTNRRRWNCVNQWPEKIVLRLFAKLCRPVTKCLFLFNRRRIRLIKEGRAVVRFVFVRSRRQSLLFFLNRTIRRGYVIFFGTCIEPKYKFCLVIVYLINCVVSTVIRYQLCTFRILLSVLLP